MKDYIQYFLPVLDEDEEVLWADEPVFFPFITKGFLFFAFGLVWGLLDFTIMVNIFSSSSSNGNQPPTLFMIGFFVLHSFPFWGSILYMIYLCLIHKNTFYAATNKRVIIRTGFWGIDYKIIDYDKISDMDVNVNPIENIFRVGTITFYSGRTNNRGMPIGDSFVAIRNPYTVFKMIKKIVVDIKTDWEYPNALRPDENPGYKTKYKGYKK